MTPTVPTTTQPISSWKDRYQIYQRLELLFQNSGASALLPHQLDDEAFAMLLSCVEDLEAGAGASGLASQILGNFTLFLYIRTPDRAKTALEVLNEASIHRLMQVVCDELILEDLVRRGCAKKVNCTELDGFFLESRPTLLELEPEERWPAELKEFRNALQARAESPQQALQRYRRK